jgi:hypothetical protein
MSRHRAGVADATVVRPDEPLCRNCDVGNVAAWAGHSVETLLKIYAKCLDGGTELLRKRVQAALGHHGR